MCFASSPCPHVGNEEDLTVVEKDWYQGSSGSRSIARCRIYVVTALWNGSIPNVSDV